MFQAKSSELKDINSNEKNNTPSQFLTRSQVLFFGFVGSCLEGISTIPYMIFYAAHIKGEGERLTHFSRFSWLDWVLLIISLLIVVGYAYTEFIINKINDPSFNIKKDAEGEEKRSSKIIKSKIYSLYFLYGALYILSYGSTFFVALLIEDSFTHVSFFKKSSFLWGQFLIFLFIAFIGSMVEVFYAKDCLKCYYDTQSDNKVGDEQKNTSTTEKHLTAINQVMKIGFIFICNTYFLFDLVYKLFYPDYQFNQIGFKNFIHYLAFSIALISAMVFGMITGYISFYCDKAVYSQEKQEQKREKGEDNATIQDNEKNKKKEYDLSLKNALFVSLYFITLTCGLAEAPLFIFDLLTDGHYPLWIMGVMFPIAMLFAIAPTKTVYQALKKERSPDFTGIKDIKDRLAEQRALFFKSPPYRSVENSNEQENFENIEMIPLA